MREVEEGLIGKAKDRQFTHKQEYALEKVKVSEEIVDLFFKDYSSQTEEGIKYLKEKIKAFTESYNEGYIDILALKSALEERPYVIKDSYMNLFVVDFVKALTGKTEELPLLINSPSSFVRAVVEIKLKYGDDL